MLRKLQVEVETELGLDEDQKDRVTAMVTGNGHLDHQGRYLDRYGDPHEIARIHFTCDPAKSEGVIGSETTIDGIDRITFPSDVHVVLEGTDGSRTGMNAARCAIEASWSYGLLFQVDDQVWFAGRDQPDGGEIEAGEPILKRVSGMASDRPGGEPFALAEDLPAEGEFWITQEDEPSVVSIPWWGGFSGEPDPQTGLPTPELCKKQREIIEALTARVRALEPAAEAGPDI